MEELEMFLDVAIEKKELNTIWDIYLKSKKGSSLKEKAAREYIRLCENPIELWKLRNDINASEETKKIADEKLDKFPHPRENKAVA